MFNYKNLLQQLIEFNKLVEEKISYWIDRTKWIVWRYRTQNLKAIIFQITSWKQKLRIWLQKSIWTEFRRDMRSLDLLSNPIKNGRLLLNNEFKRPKIDDKVSLIQVGT